MGFIRSHEPGGVPGIRQEQASKITRDTFFFVMEDNYDEHAELAIPFYREMHSELLAFAPEDSSSKLRVLDLGLGTGKTSLVFLEHYPNSFVVGIDLFEEMLGHARTRLSKYADRVELSQADFRYAPLGTGFDVCVSALSLHHLVPFEKKELFARIREALGARGVFLMIDWTKFGSTRVQRVAFENAIRHVKRAVPESVANKWSEHWRNENIPDQAEDLVGWLRDAGFSRAECVIRHYGMGLFVAETS